MFGACLLRARQGAVGRRVSQAAKGSSDHGARVDKEWMITY